MIRETRLAMGCRSRTTPRGRGDIGTVGGKKKNDVR